MNALELLDLFLLCVELENLLQVHALDLAMTPNADPSHRLQATRALNLAANARLQASHLSTTALLEAAWEQSAREKHASARNGHHAAPTLTAAQKGNHR